MTTTYYFVSRLFRGSDGLIRAVYNGKNYLVKSGIIVNYVDKDKPQIMRFDSAGTLRVDNPNPTCADIINAI